MDNLDNAAVKGGGWTCGGGERSKEDWEGFPLLCENLETFNLSDFVDSKSMDFVWKKVNVT